MNTTREAANYVRNIKSPGKKAYAIAYLNYRTHNNPEPVVTQHNLTYMAAQAVRMSIDGALGIEAHEHQWGPVEHARMTGNPHRKCQVAGCGAISLDLDDDPRVDAC